MIWYDIYIINVYKSNSVFQIMLQTIPTKKISERYIWFDRSEKSLFITTASIDHSAAHDAIANCLMISLGAGSQMSFGLSILQQLHLSCAKWKHA